jgi:lysozyme
MYNISDNGVALIAQFEGLVLHPYLDQIKVPTIGYGTTFYPNGKKVTMKDANITKEQAEEYLRHYVDTVAVPAIVKYIEFPLSQNQVDALCSFVYNLGAGALETSTLRKKINAKASCVEIQAEFKKWTRAGGKVLDDLVRRRAKEAQLFCIK